MMIKGVGLAALLNVSDTRDFVENVWPDGSYVTRGPVDRLSGLVDYEFSELVKMKKQMTLACFKNKLGEDVSIKIHEGQEKALYDAGFTIYFRGLRSDGLDRWGASLDEELGTVRGGTLMSAFASRRGRGLPMHYDHQDNFVVQARGAKRWRLAKNTHVKNPTDGYTLGEAPRPKNVAEAPNGFPTEIPPHDTIVLEPGAVLFMPRGMWHDTETVDDESLHFNFECALPTWKDVVEYALLQTTALHGEPLREAIPRSLWFDKRIAVGADLREHLLAVCDAIASGEMKFDRDALHRFVARRRTG